MMMNGIIGFVGMMDQHELLEAVEEQKAAHECDHCPGGIDMLLAGQFKNLGQYFKTHDAQQHAGCKTEDEMQPVAELEREQPSGKGREKCRKRQEYGAHGLPSSKLRCAPGKLYGQVRLVWFRSGAPVLACVTSARPYALLLQTARRRVCPLSTPCAAAKADARIALAGMRSAAQSRHGDRSRFFCSNSSLSISPRA